MQRRTSVPFRLTINLLVPGKVLSRAIVNAGDPCGVLQKLFQNQNMIFVDSGMTIDTNWSFECYGIQTSETLVALPENSDAVRQVGRWIQTSRESEAFDSLINSMINAPTRGESMRLRDVALMKKEMSRRHYLNRVSSVENQVHPTVHCDVTQVTDKADNVSTAPLPTLW
jgi:hypothetical protein